MISRKVSCCIDWTERIIPTKDYAYLDKNKSLGLLDKNLQNQNNEDFFSQYNKIYWIKCNVDNKNQSFKLWPKPFIKPFTSSSGSSLQ